MATSTEQINNLITGYTDLKAYYEGARDGIEDAKNEMQTQVDASLADLPEALRASFWVNPVDGDDANAGSSAAPFSTLAKAFGAAPPNGQATVYLVEDLTLTAKVYLPEGASVTLNISDGKTLTLGTFVDAALNQNDSGGFYAANGVGPIALRVNGGRVVWPSDPSPTTGVPNRHNRYISLLASNYAAGPAHLHVECFGVTFEMPADGVGCVVGADARGCTLAVKNVTITGDMAGHWVAGQAAATLTADAGNVVSNLTSL